MFCAKEAVEKADVSSITAAASLFPLVVHKTWSTHLGKSLIMPPSL